MPSALSRLKLLSASFAAVSALRPMMMSTAAASVSPPVAKRVAHTVTFGKVDGENRGTNPMEPVELQDDLFWIRDDTRKNEEVLQLLREENDYSQHVTAHQHGFRGDLYNEMLSHVQEDDDTYPSPAPDGYEYWSRTIKGKSFRVYLRRPRGSGAGEQEQTILDVNEVLTPANPDANASPGSNPDSNPDPDASF